MYTEALGLQHNTSPTNIDITPAKVEGKLRGFKNIGFPEQVPPSLWALTEDEVEEAAVVEERVEAVVELDVGG